jgi:predicted DNA binding CopG/RHH family protein
MNETDKIPASDEAWESGKLGEDFKHAKVLKDDGIDFMIDDALELQSISIRLQKSLIEDFKAIAHLNGVGYQPLMRQVLTRFADCEKKRILRERVEEMKEQAAKQKANDDPQTSPARKAA